MNATIDETLERVEQLYTALTGKPPPTPNGHSVAIPPETDPVVHVEQQLGRMVSGFERLLPSMSAPAWTPRAVVWTRDREVVLSIDVPGVTRDDLKIRIQPLALTITGHRRVPWAQTPRGVAACDAPFGTFARSFPIAAGVAPEHISGRLDDGVLTIRIHAGTKAEPSQILVTS